MHALCERLRNDAELIIAEWDRLASGEDWHELPPDVRVDGLVAVVLGLLDAALCEPEALESHRRKVEAAVEHGRQRRSIGFGESQLLLEYHFLRQAMWTHLKRVAGERDRQIDAIFRIDTAITLATNGSLCGYYAPEIERNAVLSERIEELAKESPFLRTSDDAP